MGLDMHLSGEQYLHEDYEDESKNIIMEGYRLKAYRYDLGYWWKHPDLHGFIVENFATQDDCQPVYLDGDDLLTIIQAVQENRLPHTEGFFFGESGNDEAQKAEDIQILSKARKWLADGDWTRSVYYQASW